MSVYWEDKFQNAGKKMTDRILRVTNSFHSTNSLTIIIMKKIKNYNINDSNQIHLSLRILYPFSFTIAPPCHSSSASIILGVFFLFHLKVGVEEWIVNAPLLSLQSKNTNNAKSGAFTVDSSTPTLR
jgi:hypothetical protein